MIRNYIVIVLIVGIVLTPVNFTYAETNTDSQQVLLERLTAIVSYLERTFNLGNTKPLSSKELRSSIIKSGLWISDSQEESGHFAYEYQPYEDIYLDDDNIVRQAGALYALGEIEIRDVNETTDFSETVELSIEFFEGLSEKDTFGGHEFKCITKNNSSNKCTLGATSLALVGILSYIEAHPENEAKYSELIENYISYILSAKKEDEGFMGTYRTESKLQTYAESSFSNGEALLALVRYYKFNPREDVKLVIDDTFSYLKAQELDTALYLWIMAALKDMNELWPKEEYIDYADKFTTWRVSRVSLYKNTKKNYCAVTEGIVSAYSVLENSYTEEKRKFLKDEIDFWNKKNIRLQIGANDTLRFTKNEEGVFSFQKINNMEQAEGGFLTSDDVLTQRIDFTQHCIGSYVQTLVDIDGEEL